MIIVSGTLTLQPGKRGAFLDLTRASVEAARQAPGCHAFVVAADSIAADVAIVYEAWATEEDLLAFRGQGPSPDMRGLIAKAAVQRHHVARSEPA